MNNLPGDLLRALQRVREGEERIGRVATLAQQVEKQGRAEQAAEAKALLALLHCTQKELQAKVHQLCRMYGISVSG
jgi:hypothetical protein